MIQKGVVCASKRAAAEENRRDSPGGLFIGDADESASRFLFDSHFRNDGNAHAGAYHAEETAELAAFENDLRMEARAVASGDGGVAEAVAIAEKQEGFRAEIFEGKFAAHGELVLLGKCGEKTFVEQGSRVKFVAANRKRQNGDVNRTPAKPIQKKGRNFLFRGSGAGSLRTAQRRSWHGIFAGQDAAGAANFVSGCSSLSPRRKLRFPSSEQAAVPVSHLQQGWGDALRRERRLGGELRTKQLWRADAG